MGIKFEQGKPYNTVKTLGIVKKAGGFFQISQHTGKDGPDITPAEQLTFEGRSDGRLWFVRADGTRVAGHPTHFDNSNAYNMKGELVKADPSTLEGRIATASARVEQRRLEMEAAAGRLAKLLAEMTPVEPDVEVPTEASPEPTPTDPTTLAARDEAEALLEG